MKTLDIGRVRETVTMGWEFARVIPSPYISKYSAQVKNDGHPLTAQFNFVIRHDGIAQPDPERIVRPAMKALTLDEIADGLQAAIHVIPEEVIEQGYAALMREVNLSAPVPELKVA